MEIRSETASQLLRAVQAVLTESAKPSRALKTILGQAVSLTGADRGLFVEVSGRGELQFRVLYRYESGDWDGDAGRYSRAIIERAMRTRRPVRIANALNDPDYAGSRSVQDFQLVSVLCMPIDVEGTIRGLIHLESHEKEHFTEDHETLLGSLVEIAAPTLAVLQAGEGVLRERDDLRRSRSKDQTEIEQNRELLARDWSFGRFIGRAPAVRELERQVANAAGMGFPVLLAGETGTGKSILARVLHHASPRSKQALVTVFCPSLEKGMVETELFGHRRGAFTGAVNDRIGKVQAAERGTLFLDEIGELQLEIQPKLLRLLQEKTYERVGDATEQTADAWVIAATNRDLDEEVQAGRFRRDLFERLNYVPVRVPPLRERREDIPLLLRHCLDQHPNGRWIEVSDDAATFLRELDFSWPGNARHIEQLAVRLAMERPDEPVTPDDLQRLLGSKARSDGDGDATLEAGLPALLAREEKRWIEEAMRRYPDLSRADLADKLKISESGLYKKLRLYGLS